MGRVRVVRQGKELVPTTHINAGLVLYSPQYPPSTRVKCQNLMPSSFGLLFVSGEWRVEIGGEERKAIQPVTSESGAVRGARCSPGFT